MGALFGPSGWSLRRRDVLRVGGAGLAAALTLSAAQAQEPTRLLVWSWLPDFQMQVDLFMAAHPEIEVELVNAGQGAAQYTALRAALQAGSGLPDVVQIEFQFLESFRQVGALADIGATANAFRDEFPAGTWSQVSDGDAVFAMPQDSGPMAMLYRTDILEANGIAVPTTWAEFAEAAKALHAANPDVFMTDALFSEGAWVTALLWQMGWQPVTREGDTLTIAINDPIAMEFAAYWQDLLDVGVIEAKPAFNTEWYTALDQGRYATWITAGWGPVFLTSFAETSAGQWRAADLPQWDAGTFATSNWGGSTLAVTAASENPEAAALFATWVNTDPEATRLYTTQQFLFPTRSALLSDPAWVDQTFEFYGGQPVNQVFAKSANAVPPFQWSPFQDFLYQSMADELGAAVNGEGTLAEAFDRIQASVVAYATEQGFTVN